MRSGLLRVLVPWLALAAAGCASSAVGPEARTLLGRWEWVSSQGGIAGVTQTPASTGRTMTLAFTAERASLWIDGALSRSTGYRLSDPRGEGDFEVVYVEPLQGFVTQTGSFPAPDSLRLADGCCDGFTSWYVRVR